MFSVVLLLGTLFTLGECGGDTDPNTSMPAGNIAGTGGPDPTPKPTEPPFFGGTGCQALTDGICDEKTTDLTFQTFELQHMSDAGCAQFCEKTATEEGAGCCQWGGCHQGHIGYQCGVHVCKFFKGSQDVENPYSEFGSSYRGKNFKMGMCTAGGAEEADEAMLNFASTSGDSALVLARNVCAAVGLSAVLYGAYKHYFGAKN